VYVDGRRVGQTDPESGAFQQNVPSGQHELRLSSEGHDDVVRLLHLDPGERVRLSERLPESARAAEESAAGTGALSAGEVVAVAAAFLLGLVLVGWAWRRALAPVPDPSFPGVDTPTPARETPTPSGELPQRFGEYTLVGRLGRGGMATVYEAERQGERVALKRPLGSFVEDPQFIERFLREAELGRALNHPNIVRIFDRGDCEGVPYFTMELLRGRTLREELRERRSFAPGDASRAVVQVAEALDYAHSKGVVHRDLKPSNIWLGERGGIKVMDFGIARARRFDGMTATGAFLGTPEYISPEVVEGESADARSDLYALGVVYYELVTGRRPFVGSSAFAVFRKHATETATPPSALVPGIPGAVERIIQKLLEKDPARRFDSAEALVVELRDFLNRGE
jgi:serine/threonine protein kinase